MVVMEEFGAALVVEPFIETVVVAGQLLARSPHSDASTNLERISEGLDRYAFAHFEPADATWRNRTGAGTGWRLTGEKVAVLPHHGPTGCWSAWATPAPGNRRLFMIDVGSPGLGMRSYATIDGRCAADLIFDNVQVDDAALLLADDEADLAIAAALDAARAAQCAEALGLMRRMLRDTVAYTGGRRQFGKALSDFQVLRHRMVDMAIQIESATSAVYLGTLKLSASPCERERAISTMSVMVDRALRYIWQNAIQLHGGMGMTDELALGHYAKRAIAIEQSYGGAEWHLRRFAALRSAA